MVTTRLLRKPFDRYPFAREAMVAIAAVGAFGLWLHLIFEGVQRYIPLEAIDAPGGATVDLALTAGLTSAIALAGMVLFVRAYIGLRDIELSLSLPDRRALAYGAGGAGVAIALVGIVQLVATLAGGSLSTATGTSYGPGATLAIGMTVTALGLSLGIPAYVLLTHVLVQRSIERAADPMVSVGLTAIVVGTIGPTAALNTSPIQGTIGVVLLLGAVAVPVVAAEYYDRDWLTVLTGLPLLVLLAGVFVERVGDVAGATDVVYLVAVFGIVAVGAYAFERTDSMLPSALAYATFVVTAELVVYATQVGSLV